MMSIAISGIDTAARPVSRIEFDGYTLNYWTYEPPLGGIRDVRLGALSPSFLELTLGLDSNTLRALTLVGFETIHDPIDFGDLPATMGLPILDVEEAQFQGQMGCQYLDLPVTFSVGFGSDFIELDFGMLVSADQALVCGPAKFLVRSGALLGIQLSGLSSEQLALIGSTVLTKGQGGMSEPMGGRL